MFKKLALVTAIAALPVSGFAMEALEDTALSDVTGQDGISLTISLNSTLNLGIEDTDGLGAPSTDAGMILITGMSMVGNAEIEIDSASTGLGGGVIQIGVNIPTLTIQTGNISVGQGTDGTVVANGFAALTDQITGGTNVSATIIESVGLTLTGLDLTLQVGSEASNLVAIATTGATNIAIGTLNDAGVDDFVLNDLSTGGGGAGSLIVDHIAINNVDLNGITMNIDGSAGNEGLVISTNAALSNMQVAAMGVKLGTSAEASIGNIYVTGLNLSNQTITVTGH